LRGVLDDGSALAKFRQFVIGQGGDPAFIDNPAILPQAPVRHLITSTQVGYVSQIDAETIGRASVEVGAGRAVKEAKIDHSVGFVLQAKVGDRVEVGDGLATIHAASQTSALTIERMLRPAFGIGPQPVQKAPTIREVVM
jgi:pyrimidine-nucleoside phosphorylase